MRQEDVDLGQAYLADPQLHGVVILGPRGVGKSTLANNVARRLGEDSHVVRLFGTGVHTEVPYAIFPVQLARLNARQSESPSAILGALVEQIFHDAHGRPIVLLLDDLPGIDTLSTGVLMHLVLGGKAKLLVAARSVEDLPDDFVWMIKDGLLAQQRLAPLSRDEARVLLVKALDGPVAESVVAMLYTASAGNPLVLQALTHEHKASGVLQARDGIWVQVGCLQEYSDDILSELVGTRMARETEELRNSIEKFSLLRNVPLTTAIRVLGVDAVTALEERGFLAIAPSHNKNVTFAEPYFGDMVRNQLSVPQKAAYFQDLSDVLAVDVAQGSPQEQLIFASWINEAGMDMEPEVALAAAQAALQFFDPQLALTCTSHIPAGHPLAVAGAQKRSRAHYLMSNYSKAAEELESISPQVLAALTAQDYAAWAMDLTVALVWLPERMLRIEQILDVVKKRIEQASGEEREDAEKFYNLARFEVHIHRGEFLRVLHDLTIASKDPHDRVYRLNCASMLTMALAATGRAVDAVELSQAIDAEAQQYDVVLRMNDWHLYGRILGLIWSGQWRYCEATLQPGIELSNAALRFKGGALDLSLGMVYALAGKDMQAAESLLLAAAQLEVRDSFTGLCLAYSALAFVYARLGDQSYSRRYLALAKATDPHIVWVNRSLADFFLALALHTLGDPTASDILVNTAERDYESGRFSPATLGLLAAVSSGDPGQVEFLAQAAQSCQGELAEFSLLLSQAILQGSAQLALEAAALAKALEITALERHANELVLQLATKTGDRKLQRGAWESLRGEGYPGAQLLMGDSEVQLTPRELQVARLANRGMGNRDIADKIGVSVRTVEGHLYQVFAKLGIASRADLEKRGPL